MTRRQIALFFSSSLARSLIDDDRERGGGKKVSFLRVCSYPFSFVLRRTKLFFDSVVHARGAGKTRNTPGAKEKSFFLLREKQRCPSHLSLSLSLDERHLLVTLVLCARLLFPPFLLACDTLDVRYVGSFDVHFCFFFFCAREARENNKDGNDDDDEDGGNVFFSNLIVVIRLVFPPSFSPSFFQPPHALFSFTRHFPLLVRTKTKKRR